VYAVMHVAHINITAECINKVWTHV